MVTVKAILHVPILFQDISHHISQFFQGLFPNYKRPCTTVDKRIEKKMRYPASLSLHISQLHNFNWTSASQCRVCVIASFTIGTSSSFLPNSKKKAVSCRTIQTATPFVVSGLLLYLRQQNSTIFYANALKTLPTVQSKCFWHYRMHDFSSVTRLCTHWEKVALFIQMSSQSSCFIFSSRPQGDD
jgi:hypothetical protein